jgi:hypothetical protein
MSIPDLAVQGQCCLDRGQRCGVLFVIAVHDGYTPQADRLLAPVTSLPAQGYGSLGGLQRR